MKEAQTPNLEQRERDAFATTTSWDLGSLAVCLLPERKPNIFGALPTPHKWLYTSKARLAASVCRLRHDPMKQGPTEPSAGRGTFLLSSGGAGDGYY